MKTPAPNNEEHDPLSAALRRDADTKPYNTPRDQWVKVRWEMIGGEVRVRIGDITLQGHRDAIALPKTTVAFPVTGGAAQVRGLKIWEASRAK